MLGFVKFSEVKVGDILYVGDCAHGHHFLDSQLEDGYLIGFYWEKPQGEAQ